MIKRIRCYENDYDYDFVLETPIFEDEVKKSKDEIHLIDYLDSPKTTEENNHNSNI